MSKYVYNSQRGKLNEEETSEKISTQKFQELTKVKKVNNWEDRKSLDTGKLPNKIYKNETQTKIVQSSEFQNNGNFQRLSGKKKKWKESICHRFLNSNMDYSEKML